MSRIFAYLVGVLAAVYIGGHAPAYADSVPFWGAKESVAAGTPISQLKKGQFLWMAEAVTSGPIVMVVSITEQKAYVYRNGILIGATTVSTGRPGHLTPTGVFTVLQKQKEHRSTIYDGAPMPYMERLTWGGIALHAGGLPGLPGIAWMHPPAQRIRQGSLCHLAGRHDGRHRRRGERAYLGHASRLSRAGQRQSAASRRGGSFCNRAIRIAGSPRHRQRSGQHRAQSPESTHRRLSQRHRDRPRQDRRHRRPTVRHARVGARGRVRATFPDPYVPDASKYHWLRIGVPGHTGEAGGRCRSGDRRADQDSRRSS